MHLFAFLVLMPRLRCCKSCGVLDDKTYKI